MTRQIAPALSDFGVANLRNSAQLRAIRALNLNSADTICSAQTYSEVPYVMKSGIRRAGTDDDAGLRGRSARREARR